MVVTKKKKNPFVQAGRPLFRAKELLLFVPLLLLAAGVVLLLLDSPRADSVRIERNGELVKEIAFSEAAKEENGELLVEIPGETPDGISVTVLVTGEYACFQSSGCPDQICVRSGKLSRQGESAVCLPAGVSIRLTGSGGVDGVTY